MENTQNVKVNIVMNWREEQKLFKEKENNALKLFFDFYAMVAIDYFAGEKTLNYPNKIGAINKHSSGIYNLMYNMIYNNLKNCILHEAEYIESKENWWGRVFQYNTWLKIIKRKVKQNEINKNIELILHAFSQEDLWDSEYGGELWANATRLLISVPNKNNTTELISWVDKVLDLYHNTGHLFNKRGCVLSTLSRKGRKIYNKKTPLNFRKNASLSELVRCAGSRTQNIYTVNKKLLEKLG